LELSYGTVRGKIFAPKNVKIIQRQYKIVLRILEAKDPIKYIKYWAHQLRCLALNVYTNGAGWFVTRGFSNNNLFVASTISRAIRHHPCKSKVDNELDAALERLTSTKVTLSDDKKVELDAFIKQLCESKVSQRVKENLSNSELPVPGIKATINSRTTDGGCSEILVRYKDVVKSARADKLLTSMNSSVNMDDLWSNEGDVSLDAFMNQMIKDEEELHAPITYKDILTTIIDISRGNTLKDIRADFLKRTAECDLFSFIQEDGKIRCPTKHSSETVWVARTLNQSILPIVKTIGVTRDTLAGRKIRLKNTSGNIKNLYMFSADFTKSTDEIGIDTAKFIMRCYIKHLGLKPIMSDLVDYIFRPYYIRSINNKPITSANLPEVKCGALMGLGPSWTVLCTLNAFCARHTNKESYSVCGDDLAGLWSKREINRYKSEVRECGLVLNDTKSFISPSHGVFCEKLMKRKGIRTAYSTGFIRIAQAVGMRAIGGNKGYLVSDTLYNLSSEREHVLKPIRKVAHLVSKSYSIHHTTKLKLLPGPFGFGGSGASTCGAYTVLSYALFGPLKLSYKERTKEDKTRLHAIREKVKVLPNRPQGVPFREVMISAKSINDTEERWTGAKVNETKTIRRRYLISEIKKRISKIEHLISLNRGVPIKDFLTQLLSSRTCYTLNSKQCIKKTIHFMLNKKFTRAVKVLTREFSRKKVDLDKVKDIFESSNLHQQKQYSLELSEMPADEVGIHRYYK